MLALYFYGRAVIMLFRHLFIGASTAAPNHFAGAAAGRGGMGAGLSGASVRKHLSNTSDPDAQRRLARLQVWCLRVRGRGRSR